MAIGTPGQTRSLLGHWSCILFQILDGHKENRQNDPMTCPLEHSQMAYLNFSLKKKKGWYPLIKCVNGWGAVFYMSLSELPRLNQNATYSILMIFVTVFAWDSQLFLIPSLVHKWKKENSLLCHMNEYLLFPFPPFYSLYSHAWKHRAWLKELIRIPFHLLLICFIYRCYLSLSLIYTVVWGIKRGRPYQRTFRIISTNV